MHPTPVTPLDFERRVTELTERIAADYEADLELEPIVDAVRDAREDVERRQIDGTDDGLQAIEHAARQHLDDIAQHSPAIS